MPMLFDYWCEEHGRFETWGNSGQEARCPSCGKLCKQMPSAVKFSLPGTDPGFPTAWHKWADRHERHEEPGSEF